MLKIFFFKDVEVKSEGSFSVDSLSSVRTSELSNFEDAISACSDGETNGKLIIPLKIANDLYTRGKLSQIYHISRKGQNHKNLFNNKNLEDTSSSSSVNAMSASRPQRIRKPNSKYNSEFMYCDVKDYSSSNIDSGSSSSPEEKNAAATPLPLKRQRKHKKIFEQ
ncbi:uncharacterized protein NPIL_463421 [Nephila pilipes]|uniref:Uncharacterized protein n=1 Tax=Nephila pilipes TaxID=299642 RepID=A0A8X6P140_NEPPI|nr:uncharacterized protein NPIL_236751 [Nephila pilipes]GFS97035.1 uncharacterized protein NPIL_199581 [Nephila pilipes]GFT43158.1 uncharacterized protein NPIL_139441 [Nephila pilipes]GFU38830.1 uncharacterized protein NPIL_463421 [Nephila pilipes]